MNRTAGYVRAVARLKDGVTLEQAQREAEMVAAGSAARILRRTRRAARSSRRFVRSSTAICNGRC